MTCEVAQPVLLQLDGEYVTNDFSFYPSVMLRFLFFSKIANGLYEYNAEAVKFKIIFRFHLIPTLC